MSTVINIASFEQKYKDVFAKAVEKADFYIDIMNSVKDFTTHGFTFEIEQPMTEMFAPIFKDIMRHSNLRHEINYRLETVSITLRRLNSDYVQENVTFKQFFEEHFEKKPGAGPVREKRIKALLRDWKKKLGRDIDLTELDVLTFLKNEFPGNPQEFFGFAEIQD
jgi:hypothetical protein